MGERERLEEMAVRHVEEARRGSRRRVKQLDDGTFAPRGLGRVLPPSPDRRDRKASPPTSANREMAMDMYELEMEDGLSRASERLGHLSHLARRGTDAELANEGYQNREVLNMVVGAMGRALDEKRSPGAMAARSHADAEHEYKEARMAYLAAKEFGDGDFAEATRRFARARLALDQARGTVAGVMKDLERSGYQGNKRQRELAKQR